jgi:hypothetical protein
MTGQSNPCGRSQVAGVRVSWAAALMTLFVWASAPPPTRGGEPTHDAQTSVAVDRIEQARVAATAYAESHGVPRAEVDELRKRPLAQTRLHLPSGEGGTRYEWLGSGKGGGWFVHVVIGDASGSVQVVGGFASE